MKRPTIGLGRLLGIRIELDYSWFLVFALLTWSLATGYYTQALPGAPARWTWGLGALSAVLLFASVLLHELGHALVARRDQVPVRRITLFLFGGVAELGAEPPGPLADSPDADLWLALEAMQRDGVNQLPVLADHHTLGLLSRDGVITFLRTRRELGA